MKQYEYFAADYRTGKKQLKKEFVNDMVALFENENATIDDMRKGRKVLKAQFKADKKALKSKSKALEKAFRKDYGMLRRPIMADIFDFFEEDRAAIKKISYEEPKLEDVFLSLTGKSLRD